jgi:histidine triad (HIT) family protein
VRSGCTFCEIALGTRPAHRVFEDEACVGFLDTRPLFPGHVLVVPRSHFETLADLPPELVLPFFGAVRRLSVVVEAALGADGTFVALNNKVSQSVAHLHVHVVPRRKKDGLRGFFWPRQKYANDEDAARVAELIRGALTESSQG